METYDPTVQEVWDTVPRDIQKEIVKVANAIANRKKVPYLRLSKSEFDNRLNDDQKTAIWYLIGEAAEGFVHPIIRDYFKRNGTKSQCVSKFGGSTVIEHHEEYKAMWVELVQVVDKYLRIMKEMREGN